jgi:hypothetical protein
MPPVSKIARFPDHIRKWLHQALVERAFGDIVEITAEVNTMLQEAGLEERVGKSAVGEESKKLRRAVESMRATTEAARAFNEAAGDDADVVGRASMAMVQDETMRILQEIRTAEAITDPVERLGLMGDAALTLTRLSRGKVYQARWQQEVDERALAAADAVAKITKQGGLTDAQQNEIRARILGITKPPAKPAAGG